MWGHSEKVAIYKPGWELSRTIRKFLLFKSCSVWYFVGSPNWDNGWYREIQNLHILILYSEVLVSLLINFNCFSIDSFGFSAYIISSTNNDSFIHSFLILLPFTYCFWLTVLARTLWVYCEIAMLIVNIIISFTISGEYFSAFHSSINSLLILVS